MKSYHKVTTEIINKSTSGRVITLERVMQNFL